MKAWDDETLERLRVQRPRTPNSLRDITERSIASLRSRLAANTNRGMRHTPPGHWGSWSPEAIAAVRGGGGNGRRNDLPEAKGCPYELRVLYRPGQPDAGGESRWYTSDIVALRAFGAARALLTDPELGLGLALLHDGCLVYEWTEPSGSEWRDLDVGAHRRRGCPGHEGGDVFDRLARLHDHYSALGYRPGGECLRGVCAAGCPGNHGDLYAAMIRAEAAEIAGEPSAIS